MKVILKQRYNRTMPKTFKTDIAKLVKRLEDPRLQKVLEHPLFEEAFTKVCENNQTVVPTNAADEIDIPTSLLWLEDNICSFEVMDDGRLLIVDVDGGTGDCVYRDGRFIDVDDDGVEMED